MEKLKFTAIAITAAMLTQNTYAMTLSEVFDKVMQSNPFLLASKYGVDIAEESMEQARSSFYPSIDVTASALKVDNFAEETTDTKSHPKQTGVSFSQPIFAGGSIYSGFKSSKSAFKATSAAHKSDTQLLLTTVVDAYVNVLTTKEVYDLQKNQVKLLQEQLVATKARFDQGELTRTDIQQAQARLSSAEADMIDAKGNYKTALTRLNNLTGESVTDLSWPNIKFNLPKTYTDELKSQVLSSHPDIIEAEETLESSEYNVRVAKADFYPTISAVASYTNNNDTSNGDFDDQRVGFQLSYNLFQGGDSLSKVRSAISQKEQGKQNLQQAQRDTVQELVDAIELYKTAQASLVAFKQNEKAAELAEEGVSKEESLGERTVLDLLDARQELLEARVNVTQAKGRVITQAFNLLKATGELNPSSADEVN